MGQIWWVASYPKSGNTWVRALLASLISGAPVDINDMSVLGGAIASSRALIDEALGIESAELSDEQQAALRPQAYNVIASQATEPLYLKVHDTYGMTPSGEPLFPTSATAGAVYIVRNPLDVAVSLAHYSGIPISKTVDNLLAPPTAGFGRSSGMQFPQQTGDWATHVNSWLAAPFPVKLVRYEDLLADGESVFGGVVQFLKRSDGPVEIGRAIRDCAFENLRSQEEQAGFRSNSRSGNRFFRRGIEGAWRDELPVKQARRIVEVLGPAMRHLGY